MMTFSITLKSQLEGAERIDAEYYQPEYLIIDSQIKRHNYSLLGEIANKISDGTHFTPHYQKNGIPFLSALNVLENRLNLDAGFEFISKIDHKKLYKRCDPKSGDLLIRKVGVGARFACVIPEGLPEFSIFVSLALVRCDTNKINPFFLSTFINSIYGQLQLMRFNKGVSQPDLHLEEIKRLIVPIFSLDFQQKIQEYVVLALQHEDSARQLYEEAEKLLLKELGLNNFQQKEDLTYVVNFSDIKTADRIDADFFQPKYEELQMRLKKYGTERLTKAVQNITAKFIPKPEDKYKYVELSNINSSTGMIDGYEEVLGKEAPSRAKRILKHNDVIISSVEGSLEKVAIVSENQDSYLASTGFFQLRSQELLPEVLLILAKSIILQWQMKKYCAGTILTAVPNDSLDYMIIPILPKEKQVEIADLVIKSHDARKKSKELLEQAKREVEEMIEKQAKN